MTQTKEERMEEIKEQHRTTHKYVGFRKHVMNFLINELDQAWEQNKKMKTALEYYSNADSYMCVCQEPGSMSINWDGHECSTPQDSYFDVARECLASIDEEK